MGCSTTYLGVIFLPQFDGVVFLSFPFFQGGLLHLGLLLCFLLADHLLLASLHIQIRSNSLAITHRPSPCGGSNVELVHVWRCRVSPCSCVEQDAHAVR